MGGDRRESGRGRGPASASYREEVLWAPTQQPQLTGPCFQQVSCKLCAPRSGGMLAMTSKALSLWTPAARALPGPGQHSGCGMPPGVA